LTSVGTFNIRLFPDRQTVPDVVAERLAELDADLVMVQEIRDPSAFDAVLATASAECGRRYRVALGPMCRTSELQLGVVYDEAAFSVVETRVQADLDPTGRCSCRDGHPPAFLAVLQRPDGRRLAAISVHLQFGARRWMYQARRVQWEYLIGSIDRLLGELSMPLVAAGDFNSTGYTNDDLGERSFIERTVKEAGLTLATAGVSCTAYWQPNRRRRDYVPSMLDHVLVSGAQVQQTEVLGMCAALGGKVAPGDQDVPDYREVSDHCPVRVRLSF